MLTRATDLHRRCNGNAGGRNEDSCEMLRLSIVSERKQSHPVVPGTLRWCRHPWQTLCYLKVWGQLQRAQIRRLPARRHPRPGDRGRHRPQVREMPVVLVLPIGPQQTDDQPKQVGLARTQAHGQGRRHHHRRGRCLIASGRRAKSATSSCKAARFTNGSQRAKPPKWPLPGAGARQ